MLKSALYLLCNGHTQITMKLVIGKDPKLLVRQGFILWCKDPTINWSHNQRECFQQQQIKLSLLCGTLHSFIDEQIKSDSLVGPFGTVKPKVKVLYYHNASWWDYKLCELCFIRSDKHNPITIVTAANITFGYPNNHIKLQGTTFLQQICKFLLLYMKFNFNDWSCHKVLMQSVSY